MATRTVGIRTLVCGQLNCTELVWMKCPFTECVGSLLRSRIKAGYEFYKFDTMLACWAGTNFGPWVKIIMAVIFGL